jgi:hypothetical protein
LDWLGSFNWLQSYANGTIPQAKEMAANLHPLEKVVLEQLNNWLPKLSHLVRIGERPDRFLLPLFRATTGRPRPQFAKAQDVPKRVQGGTGMVASYQLLSQQSSAATCYGKHWSYLLSYAWIISAKRSHRRSSRKRREMILFPRD